MEFVIMAKRGEETIAELCRSFGVSRETGYKLVGPNPCGSDYSRDL
jgi:hypothetical protein